MKKLIYVKLFLKKNILWCTACNCSNSSKNITDKTCFILPKKESTRKAQIATINQKESTLPKNVCLNLFIQVPYLSKFAYPSALIPRKIHCPKKTSGDAYVLSYCQIFLNPWLFHSFN